MASINKNTLQFLKDLKVNNDRDWFNKNKTRFLEAKADFEAFIDALIPEIAKFDKSVKDIKAKDCVFRIYRDTRFAKDKTPYKTNMGAHMVAGGKKAEQTRAGYYFHLEPGGCFMGGGAYMPPADWLKAIRQEIHYSAKDLKKITGSSDFKKYFGKMDGEKLKNAPKEYPKDHSEIELLKFKSYLAMHSVPDKQVVAPDFLKHAAKVFKALYPFDQFLNRAMD